jgi:CheY-like chemotaxis protein
VNTNRKQICGSVVPKGSCIDVYTHPLTLLPISQRGDVPDLVLLELEMPGRDGIKILQQICQVQQQVRMMIITVTDPNQKKDFFFQKLFGKHSDVLGYISKGVAVEYMRGQIQVAVQLILPEKKNKEILHNMERQKILFEQLFLEALLMCWWS